MRKAIEIQELPYLKVYTNICIQFRVDIRISMIFTVVIYKRSLALFIMIALKNTLNNIISVYYLKGFSSKMLIMLQLSYRL